MAILGQVLIEIAANSAAFRAELEKARGQFSQFTSGIKSGLATLGVAASVAGLTAMVKAALDAGAATREMATRMGIGTRELQELQHAARDTGTNLEALETGIRNLSRRLDEAANDSAEARETFARLGVSWRDSTGNIRDVLEVLDEVADKLNLKGQAERAALAVQLFGRSGTGMLTLLREGSKGMSELRAEAQRLGQVLSDDALKALDELQDQFDKATHGIKVEFMKAVVDAQPALESLANVLVLVGKAMGFIAEKAKALSDVFGVDVIRDELKGLATAPPPQSAFFPPGVPGELGPPAERFTPGPTIAQRIQQAQAAAAAAQNRLAIAGAAGLAAPGSEADVLQRQIALSQQKMRLDLQGLAAQRELELTDKGRLELIQKAEKVVADFIVEQIRLYKDLTEQTQRAAEAEANLFDFSGEAGAAQRDLDVAADAAGRYAEGLKEAKRQGLGIGEIELPFDVPLMNDAEAALMELGRRLNDIKNLGNVLGGSFDEGAAKIQALQNALQQLAVQGIGPTDVRVQELQDQLLRLTTIRDVITEVFSGISRGISGTIQSLIDGTRTVKDAFADMGRNIAAGLIQNVIEDGLKRIQKALITFLSNLAELGLIESLTKAGTAFIATPIAGAAEGGIVTKPTILLAGEAGSEAIIPLSRGGFGGVEINIHPAAGVETDVRQRQTSDGRTIIDIVQQALQQMGSEGSLDRILGPTFGLRRQPVGR